MCIIFIGSHGAVNGARRRPDMRVVGVAGQTGSQAESLRRKRPAESWDMMARRLAFAATTRSSPYPTIYGSGRQDWPPCEGQLDRRGNLSLHDALIMRLEVWTGKDDLTVFFFPAKLSTIHIHYLVYMCLLSCMSAQTSPVCLVATKFYGE